MESFADEVGDKEVPVPAGETRPSPPQGSIAEQEQFRAAMRNLAETVAVVTVGSGNTRTGFTATSVSSLCLDPPSLLVCLDRKSSSWPVLERRRSFCVNLLVEGQEAIADRFAGRGGVKGQARYVGAEWRELESGTLALVGALAAIECDLEEAIERHSHAILIGRVRSIVLRDRAPPLLYWHSDYGRIVR